VSDFFYGALVRTLLAQSPPENNAHQNLIES
jgi:hypothetical protein